MLRVGSLSPSTPTSAVLLPEMAGILIALNRARVGRALDDVRLKSAVTSCAREAVKARISRGELQSRLRALVEYAFSSEGDTPYGRELLEHMLAWVRAEYEREDLAIG